MNGQIYEEITQESQLVRTDPRLRSSAKCTNPDNNFFFATIIRVM